MVTQRATASQCRKESTDPQSLSYQAHFGTDCAALQRTDKTSRKALVNVDTTLVRARSYEGCVLEEDANDGA